MTCEPDQIKDVYDRYSEPIYNFLRMMTGDDRLAETLVIQTFVHASQQFPRIRRHSSAEARLFGLSYQLFVDSLQGAPDGRSSGKTVGWRDDSNRSTAIGPALESGAVSRELLQRQFLQALQIMPVRVRGATILRYVEHLNEEVITKVLKCSARRLCAELQQGRSILYSYLDSMAGYSVIPDLPT